MGIYVKGAAINGSQETMKSRESVQNVKVLIGTGQEKIKEKRKIPLKEGKMIDKNKFDLILQLLIGIEDATKKLEEAQKKKDAENFEKAKIQILEFQQKIESELK